MMILPQPRSRGRESALNFNRNCKINEPTDVGCYNELELKE
jgi:hypothetical protein